MTEIRMEVHVDRDAFLRCLQMVHNVVEARQTMPILANVLVEADGEMTRLTATDLEVGVRVSLPAQVSAAGAVTISARKLVEIVKELPPAPLAIKVQENAWVSLRCAGVAYKLVGLAPEDFPAVAPGVEVTWITVDGEMLRDMLEERMVAISHYERQYALNGVLHVLNDDEERLVG